MSIVLLIPMMRKKKLKKTIRIRSPKNLKKKKKPKRVSRRNKEAVEEPSIANVAVACPDGASEAAKTVYDVLTAQPQPVDLLAEKANMSIPVLLAALTELEMFGCATNSAGQQYQRT